MLCQSDGLLLPLLHPSTSSLACLHCMHAQGQGTARRRKNQQKNRSSFWVFFQTHSRCIITREQAPPPRLIKTCVACVSHTLAHTVEENQLTEASSPVAPGTLGGLEKEGGALEDHLGAGGGEPVTATV